MSQQNLQIVKRLFSAVRQRDEAGVLEAYHPDIQIHESPSLPYGGDHHGHQQAIQHMKGYYRFWDPLRPPTGEHKEGIWLETTGDYVMVMWQEDAIMPGSGERIELPVIGVYKVQDGRVIESRMFQDTAVVRDLAQNAQRQMK
jgi:ketosteroid isomerase-like protein